MANNGENGKDRKTEDRKLRRLQLMVHLTINLLSQQDMPLGKAVKHVEGVKRFALSLFPDKERTWEMIYEPRFHRILRERWGYISRRPKDMVS